MIHFHCPISKVRTCMDNAGDVYEKFLIVFAENGDFLDNKELETSANLSI